MTEEEIVALRLRNQRLAGKFLGGPEDVLRYFGAMQAQEFAVAKWSIGQRAAGATEADLDAAFAEGRILRTHLLRPTWHFCLREELRWIVELTRDRVLRMSAPYFQKFGVDNALAGRCRAIFERVLAGGNHLTRAELAVELAREGIVADSLTLGYILIRAELELVLCSGIPKGKRQTYALVDERAPDSQSLPRDEALAELTRRYFASRGPATVRDYCWWSSFTVGEAKRGIEMVEPALEKVTVEGKEYWFAPSSIAPGKPKLAHLLQAYDEYIISYTQSKYLLGHPGLSWSAQGGQALFIHAIVLRGRVVGHWRRAPGKKATIEVQLLPGLEPRDRAEIDAAVERYAKFVGVPVAWVEATAGKATKK